MKKKKKLQIILSRDFKNFKFKKRKLILLSYFPMGQFKGRWFFFISHSRGFINSIESVAFRRYFRKKTKRRRNKFFVRFFPHVKLTRKASGVRMGGGKGSKVYSVIRPTSKGFVLASVKRPTKFKALRLLSRFRRKFSLFLRMRALRVSRAHVKCTKPELFYFTREAFNKIGKLEKENFFG